MSDTTPSPRVAKIGRPPQWDDSKSRKLARLYMYSTLSIETIIKVLDDGFFKPGRNSAQKILNKMLGHDPRFLRPDDAKEANERMTILSRSSSRSPDATPSSSPLVSTLGANGEHGRLGDTAEVSSVATTRSSPLLIRTDLLGGFTTASSSPGGSSPIAFNTPSPVAYSANIRSPCSPCTQLPPWGSHASPSFSRVGASPLHIDTSGYGLASTGGQQPMVVESNSSYLDDLFFPRPLAQSATMLSSSTTATTNSILEIKERISTKSTQLAKHVSHLLRQWTIGSDANLHPGPSNAPSQASRAGAGRKPLPGEFFKAMEMCDQDPENWQEIADVVYKTPDFWLHPNGELTQMARLSADDASGEMLSAQDCFGNTLIHFLAAYISDAKSRDYLVRKIVSQATAKQLCATNSAGQTFLHVLSPVWFTAPEEPSSQGLLQLLDHLVAVCPRIFGLKDDYGQTFSHHVQYRLQSSGPNRNTITMIPAIMQKLGKYWASPRDAFGNQVVAVVDAAAATAYAAPRWQHTQQPLSPLVEEMSSPTLSINGTSWSGHDAATERYATHGALMKIITAAYNDPTVEDDQGRNGLHCLAEVILDANKLQEKCNSPTGSRRPPKRAYDQQGVEKSPKQGPGDKTLAEVASAATDEAPLAARLRYLEGLLSCPGIDVNHYDKSGNTVLMAFIQHLTDADEDKHRNLVAIVKAMVDAEGQGRRGHILEARNRGGETPLLLAARLGRKTVLKTLLERGANVHARDACRRGVLEIINHQLRSDEARHDTAVYGRLEACRVLLAGRYKEDFPGGDEVCHNPGVVEEWRLRLVV